MKGKDNKEDPVKYTVEVSKGNPHNFSKLNHTINDTFKGYVAVRSIYLHSYEMTVPNLSPDTVYYFRVTAANKQGTSLPSRHSIIKTPDGLPTRPGVPKSEIPTPKSIKVVWTGSHGLQNCKVPQGKEIKEDPITYKLEYADALDKKWNVVTTPTLPEHGERYSKMINGLAPGNKYMLRVSASNRFGEGPTSSIIL